jgi:holo-[acyl-carrier-protein] synthase
MMIGFDLQEVKKIKNEDKLLEKIALESEKTYIKKFACSRERTAALWAVKEAAFKALDICAGEITYKEIELCHKDSGAPYLKLYGKALEIFNKKFSTIEISISHQKNIVGAVVVMH